MDTDYYATVREEMRDRHFKFKIDGEGVSPDTIPARELFGIVLDLESAFASTARDSGAKDEDELSVSIVDIKEGSEALTLAVSGPMLRAASKVSRAIVSDDYSAIPPVASGKIRELWKKLRSTEWTIKFKPDGNGIAAATISHCKEILKPGSISGRTTLYGVCERVGGAEQQTLQIYLVNGVRETVRVKGKELTAEIGELLHKRIVGIQGEAKWDIDTWNLSDFLVDGLTEYQGRNPVEAFETLAVAAAGYWDNIAPEEFVSELRSD